MTQWEDRGAYIIQLADQGTSSWAEERGRHLTASRFRKAVYRQKHVWNDGPTIHHTISTAEGERRMAHGNMVEPIARQWYEFFFGREVKQVGLAIPKWDPRIGASIDGEVGEDGMIEIKGPQFMYDSILEHVYARKDGETFPPGYHSHIAWDHYDQMQGGMAICQKKWCDYIVYSTGSGLIYVERVLFDRAYWENELYPILQEYMRDEDEVSFSHDLPKWEISPVSAHL